MTKQTCEHEQSFECPYCGRRLSEEWSACCGEAGHGEWVCVDSGGEIVDNCRGGKVP